MLSGKTNTQLLGTLFISRDYTFLGGAFLIGERFIKLFVEIRADERNRKLHYAGVIRQA